MEERLAVRVCSICQDVDGQARVTLSREPVRTYWKCEPCNFIEVDTLDHLSSKEESEFYLHHQNCVDDPRYRKYASAVAVEAIRRFERRGSAGGLLADKALDFGCGPGPVVASLLREHGVPSDEYDPVFFPDGIREKAYGLIVACEVVEHFRQPKAEFSKVYELLRPGGWFVVQTERLDFVSSFEDWYYRKDLTHVAFYSDQTFRRLGLELGFDKVEIVDRKLVSLRRPY